MSNGKEDDGNKENEGRQVPIVEDDFAKLLKKFRIKSPLAENMAENISKTGGERVFEQPELLYERLIAWSGEVAPAQRKLILQQWFAEKNISIPEEVLHQSGLSDKERKSLAEEKDNAGAVRYVYDTEHNAVRMAKAGEPGGSLHEAEHLREIAEGGGKESPFIQGEDGVVRLNPKAKITGLELLAWESIKKGQARGETVDPLEAIAQVSEKIKVYREVLGGGGGGGSWMDDPLEFMTKMKALTSDTSTVESLRIALGEAQKAIQDLKDDQLRGTIEAQQTQIKTLTDKLGSILTTMDDLKRGQVGRTEMDILHDFVTEGVTFLKEELPSVRKDIRDGVGAIRSPQPKSAEEREARKAGFRESIQKDKDIEESGRRLFLD